MTSIVLLAGVALGIGAPAPKEAPKTNSAPLAIIGKWEVESCIVGGKEDARYSGDFWEFTSDGRVMYKSAKSQEYKIDDSKGASEFDLIVAGKGGMARAFKGIYKIEGEILTICMDLDRNRATKFESAVGSETMLLRFKHVTKKKE